MKKTASGLVAYAKAQLGKPYWYGTFGQKSSKTLYENKKKQYPDYYTANDFSKQYGVKVHDCIGLIKGYIWCDSPTDDTPNYEKGMPDMNEDMMYEKASVKGKISTMPKTAGICVLKKGHIGVYIGNGEVIEARGHAYGVVKTKLKDRGWTKWCRCPYIEYDEKTKSPAAQKTKRTYSGKYPVLPAKGSLRYGDKGEQVGLLQKLLNFLVSAKLEIDNSFGPLTLSAVKKFQKKYKLEQDGRFGPASLKKAKTIKK